MSDDCHKSEDLDVEEMAADWLGRCDGGLSPDERVELAAWLEGDPRHAAVFVRYEAGSRLLDRLAVLRTAGEPDPDLPLLDACAGKRPPRRRARIIAHWRTGIGLAAAVLVLVFVLGKQPWNRRGFPTLAQHFSTGIGDDQTVALQDGSTIWLNTDSAVRVQYTAAERRVHLVRGEALFTVAKNKHRPFVVSSGGVSVYAVGTAFNVHLRADSVEVLVTEGKVQVKDSDNGGSLLPGQAELRRSSGRELDSPLLQAGEKAVIPLAAVGSRCAAVVTLPVPEVSRVLAWRERRLEFDPEPLRLLVAEFNRYNRCKLVVGDRELGELTVGGSFRADDYQTFVRLLESSFGVVADRQPDKIVLRRAR